MTDLFESLTSEQCPHCGGAGTIPKKVTRGQRLAAARKHAGFNQTEVAHAIGKSVSHIVRCESDKTELRLSEYKILSDLFCLKVSVLTGPLDDD